MSKISKIGLQLYSVRGSLDTPEKAAETFKKLKAMGYDEGQTAGCYGMPYDLFYSLAQDEGIEIVGTHDDFNLMKTDIEKSIANHKMLHTTNMGIGGFAAQDVAAVEEFIETANRIACHIADEGMKFTYHNHSQEFFMDQGKSLLEWVIENSSKCYFQLDCGWAMNAGTYPPSFIRRYLNRFIAIHVKENC